MKILFCIGNLSKGGAERVASNLCNYLIKENEVTIITTIGEKSEYILDEKIKIKCLENEDTDKNFIIKNIERIRKLQKIVKTEKPDIIISFLPEPSYRILFFKIFNRKLKIIVSVRNDPKIEYKSKINRLVMKMLYPLANGFVFQTEEAKEYFSKKIQYKSIIIPNPIKEEFICEAYTGKREKIIVAVGRLEEQKNHKMLIEAFSKLPEEFKEYKLIIYGEGSLRNKLEEQINELKLNDRVLLPGQINNIKEKIYKASLFVLSSNYEGMPNALMEAMALGIPCISTDCPCGGPKFLIKNKENGYLIDTNDTENLYKMMEEILKTDQTRISQNANKITIKLNPKNINKKWKEYIKEIKESTNSEHIYNINYFKHILAYPNFSNKKREKK